MTALPPPALRCEGKYVVERWICVIGNVVDSGLLQVCWPTWTCLLQYAGVIPTLHAAIPTPWSWSQKRWWK